MTNIENPKKNNNKIIKIIDIMGREVNNQIQGILIYIYNDGRVKKKIII